MDTYPVPAVCFNCKSEETVEIPKGTLIADYLPQQACSTCGVVGKLAQS
jgi:hypothetical protein